VARIKT